MSDSPLSPGSRIVIAGASGLIGSALARSLSAEGHEVVRLVRREPRSPDEIRWDPQRQRIDAVGLIGCAAVVNLAGAPVAGRPWTRTYKRMIRDSRVLGTVTLAEAVASLDEPPRVFVNGSAIGFYGDTDGRAVDESAPPGDGFLSSVCVEWEEATAPAQEAGVRTVIPRTGLVVAREGGAWARLIPLFKAGAGGRMGNGRQYWSYIALHDEVAAIRHLIDTESLSGPVNLTAPDPLTNGEITEAMGRVLHRPTLLTAPAPLLRLALGDMAEDVLGSQRVLPTRLLESGFTFAFPSIEATLRAALG
ncbi:TIGR01777 family oxidoreductase [Streptomyces sp. NPDC005070]